MQRKLIAWLGLTALEALCALVWVFALPSESGSGWLLGYSKSRWLLAFALFFLAASFAGLSGLILRETKRANQISTLFLKVLSRSLLYWGVVLLLFAALLASTYLVLMVFKFTDALVLARLQRLLPLIAWILLFCLQSLIFLPGLRSGKSEEAQRSKHVTELLPTFIALAGLGLVAVFVSRTTLGLRPDRAGWDSPGTPLLGTQLLIAWLVAALVWAVYTWAQRRWGRKPRNLDLAIFIAIWGTAIALWQAQPLEPTFFSPRPLPPNWAYYPYSDAASHDLVAQNLLIGEGFTPISEKPLYSFFLAGLHTAFGQEYLDVVAAQIVALALFPAVLFAVATRLHHRFSGLFLAGAIILRERNAIALSGDINVSHSKLLMTDLPAALALAFFTLLLIKWQQDGGGRLRWALVLGACLGFIVLLRSQAVLFMPLLLLLVFVSAGKTLQQRTRLAVVALLGFALVALPWLWRNYEATGQFGYSQPLQARYLANQYSWTPEANTPGFPEGTPPSDFVRLGFASAIEFTRNYPGEVARFVSAHFLHNEVSSLLALPMRFDLADKLVTFYNLRPYWQEAEGRLWSECCSLDAYVAETPYWAAWNSAFPRDALLPLSVNLALIALGLGTAWRRWGWPALTPLGLHLAYSLSTAVARVSGWRLILPVDWVLLLYYCIGLGQISLWTWSYLTGKLQSTEAIQREQETSPVSDWRQERISQYAALIFGLSLLMPLAERVIPARYEPISTERLEMAWVQAGLADQAGMDLGSFLQQPGASVLVGRALWPRFYAAEMGEPGGDWPAFNPLPFARLGFVLAGPRGDQVVLPLSAAPEEFPNGADALIFGCRGETYFRAAAVLVTYDAASALVSGQPESWACGP